MKIYDSVVKENTNYRGDTGLSGLGAFMIILFGATTMSVLVLFISRLDSAPISPDLDLFWVFVWAIPSLMGLTAPMLYAVDWLIERASSFVTRGHHIVEYFLVSKLVRGCKSEIHCVALIAGNMLLGLYLLASAILIKLAFFTSGWLSLVVLVILSIIGFILGILFIARCVFDLQLKLRDHRNNPNAHQSLRN